MARNPKVELRGHEGQVVHPITDGDCVIFPDGETLSHKLSEQEEVMYAPEVTNSSPMFRVGEGDSADYSANVLEGAYQEAVLKGQTYVNTIQEPSADVITLPTPFTEYERTQSKTFTEMQDGTFGLNLVGQSYVNCIQEPSEPSYVALGENLEFQNKKVEYTTDGQIKSAMLNGMTLVNLSNQSDITLSNIQELTMFDSMYKKSTEYTFIITTDKECEITYQFFNVNTAIIGYPITLAKGINKHKYISPSQDFTRCILRNRSSEDVAFSNVMVIEGDYTNIDIPYFQGMQSVTMSTELENVCSRYNSSGAKNGKTFTVGTINDRLLGLSGINDITNYGFKQNTKYLMQFKISNLNLDGLSSIELIFSNSNIASGNSLFGNNTNFNISKNGVYRTVLTTSNIISTSSFVIKGIASEWEETSSTSRTLTISQIMCVEYQNGMENWDLPYFETTQLMKPLKVQSINKNLFDGIWNETSNSSVKETSNYFRITEGKSYRVSSQGNIAGSTCKFYDKNKKFIKSTDGVVHQAPSGAYYAKWFLNTTDFNSVQIEESSTASDYVPYQSKTTSALEPITLRAIGNIKDTLDLSTGEYVQRIGELQLDGSDDEGWKKVTVEPWTKDSYVTFEMEVQSQGLDYFNTDDIHALSDKYSGVSYNNARENGVGCLLYDSRGKRVAIRQTSITTLDDWKSQLQSNPIKVQYGLAKPITRKISLEYPNLQTYTDITHVQSIAMDGTLIPKIFLPSDISYKAMLKPNTSYNVIVDREVIDSTNQLTVNLGGTTANITANRTVVRTPSTLSNETLTFSGKDNRIAKAMLIEGSTLIDGDLPHFDGIGDVKLGRVVENLCMSDGIAVGGATATISLYNERIENKITATGSRVFIFPLTKHLKNGKKYFIYCPYDYQYIIYGFRHEYNNSLSYTLQSCEGINKKYAIIEIDGSQQKNPYTHFTVGCHGNIPVNTTMTIRRPILCEYVDGMENWDWESIGYFTGTRNIGNEFMRIGNKNLFDGKIELGGYTGTTGQSYNANDRVRSINKTYLKPGVYYLSSNNATAVAFGIFNIDGTFRQEHANTSGDRIKLILEQESYVHITVINPDLLNAKIQIEEASSATSYVAHKHNSLHILPNEQIPLTFEQGRISFTKNGTWENAINNTDATRIRTQLLDLEPNETYRISCGHNVYNFAVYLYDNSLLGVDGITWSNCEHYVNTTKDVHKVAIAVRKPDDSNISTSVLHQVRLEKVTDVTLRSVGNVKDELDLTRGVYIQRIGEITFDGSNDENWSRNNYSDDESNVSIGRAIFDIPVVGIGNKDGTIATINNKFIDAPATLLYSYVASRGIVEGVGNPDGRIRIAILKNRIAGDDVTSFKQWLSQNPITVQYILKTPIEHKINIPMKNESNQTIAKPNGIFTLPLMYSGDNHVDINSQIYPKVQSRDYIAYPVIASPSQLHTVFHNKLGTGNLTVDLCGTSVTSVDGTSKCTVTTPSTISQYELRLSGARNKVSNVCVFSGDYMNVNVPYVQGMMNAVNPIVKNIGKNLFNKNNVIQNYYVNRNGGLSQETGTERNATNYIQIEPNTSYIIDGAKNSGITNGGRSLYIAYYDNYKNYISKNSCSVEDDVIRLKTPSNAYYLRTTVKNKDLDNFVLIEESPTPSQYEPYKENICELKNGVIELTEDMFEQGTVDGANTIGTKYGTMKQNSTVRLRSKDIIKVKPNTNYRLFRKNGYDGWCVAFDSNQTYLGKSYLTETFTTDSQTHYIVPVLKKTDNSKMTLDKVEKFMLTELDKVITLRSLPNGVHDELNLQTGEYIQRIGEIVFDGSSDENWRGSSNLYPNNIARFDIDVASLIQITTNVGGIITICDKYNSVGNIADGIEILSHNSKSTIVLGINSSKLYNTTVDGLRQYLQQNPITVQYQLATPIVKQVDIHNFPHSYKDGHVIIESNDPSTNVTAQITYRCVANRTGQIQEHTEQVEKQEHEINELEMLILENIRQQQNG